MRLPQYLIILCLLTGGSAVGAWRFSRRRNAPREDARSSANTHNNNHGPSASKSTSSSSSSSSPKTSSSSQKSMSSKNKEAVSSPSGSSSSSKTSYHDTVSTAPAPIDPETGQPFTSNPFQYLLQKGNHLWQTIRLVEPTKLEANDIPASPPAVIIPPLSLQQQFWNDPLGFLYAQMITILLYKPPVGAVAAYTLTRLVVTRRIFRLYAPSTAENDNSVDAVLQKQQSQKLFTMPYVLEEEDVSYKRFGGIDRVRQKLLHAALGPLAERLVIMLEQQEPELTTDKNTPVVEKDPRRQHNVRLMEATMSALATTCKPGDRRSFVRDMIPLVSQMKVFQQQQQQSQLSNSAGLLHTAMDSSHVRLMDALLRVARDRLLRVAYRLARTVEFWSRRVDEPPLWANLERDQVRLAYAKAAYQAEVKRLGQVALLLLQRPKDLPEDALLQALQSTNEKALAEAAADGGNTTISMESSVDEASLTKSPWQRLQSILLSKKPSSNEPVEEERPWHARIRQHWKNIHWPSSSKFPIQWKTLTRGVFSLRKVEADGKIDAQAATDVITNFTPNPEEWSAEVDAWVTQGKTLLCNIITESLKGSSSGGGFNEEEFQRLEKSWIGDESDSTDLSSQVETMEKDWARILRYVDSLPLWRRVGEGRAVRLRDAAIVGWSRRLNILGLPLAGLQIGIAHQVHKVLEPHLPTLKTDTVKIVKKIFEIVKERGWEPIKGIWDELMNRSKSIMSGFGLQLEERSLDHMLRDLGFGDGTAASRESALEGAATQYEKDLKQGLLLNFASGRLVRLLLVQVQQLKVGMLQALDTINVLMRGNQIHFQILAAIPAVLIVTLGTRLFVRAVYNIRAKDLRPVTAAHGEMTVYLNHLESLVLLSFQRNQREQRGSPVNDVSREQVSMDPGVLGEMLLYTHRYLILLDFSRWSIPSRASDDVHGSMRQLTSAFMSWTAAQQEQLLSSDESGASEGGADLDKDVLLSQNMQWVRIVKDRHDRLNQYF